MLYSLREMYSQEEYSIFVKCASHKICLFERTQQKDGVLKNVLFNYNGLYLNIMDYFIVFYFEQFYLAYYYYFYLSESFTCLVFGNKE